MLAKALLSILGSTFAVYTTTTLVNASEISSSLSISEDGLMGAAPAIDNFQKELDDWLLSDERQTSIENWFESEGQLSPEDDNWPAPEDQFASDGKNWLESTEAHLPLMEDEPLSEEEGYRPSPDPEEAEKDWSSAEDDESSLETEISKQRKTELVKQAERRPNETPEKKAARLAKQREYRREYWAKRKAAESPEQTQVRLAKQREHVAKGKAAELPEQKQARLAKQRERKAAESPERKKARLAVKSEKRREKRAAESSEQKATRLAKRREYDAKKKAKKVAQKIGENKQGLEKQEANS